MKCLKRDDWYYKYYYYYYYYVDLGLSNANTTEFRTQFRS